GMTGNTKSIVIGGSNASNRDKSGSLSKIQVTNPFDGHIDEVAFYGVALTPDQIAQTRVRGAMGVIGADDSGTVNGADTLISIEKIMYTDGALVSVPHLNGLSNGDKQAAGERSADHMGSLLQAFTQRLAEVRQNLIDAIRDAADEWN